MSLPTTHKALVLSSFSDPLDIKLQDVPTPSPVPGSAILKVLSSHVVSYGKDVFSGKIPYPMQLPITPGSGAVCRVAAVGPDAVTLRPGQLVIVEINIRARDDPSLNILQGLFAMGPAEKLMAEEWRHGSYAEYVKAPLENIYPLDEENLINKMGYTINDLCYIPTLMVPMGGLVDLNIKPGQSVVVAPATGSFGGAAVHMALALGAKVVAAGRNEDQLKTMAGVLGPLYGDRLTTVKLVGNIDADTEALKKASPGGQGFDAYIDFSPPAAAKGTHIASCIRALKTYGKVSLMGGIREDISIPYPLVMIKSLQISGRFMYERGAIVQLIAMIEAGIVKLGKVAGVEVVGAYKLEEVEAALNAAADNSGFGKEVVFVP